MATVDFDFTTGSPRMVRTANVPTVPSFACSMWVQIVSYENFGELIGLSIDGAAPASRIFAFYTAAGALNLGTVGVTSVIWADGYTGWFWFGIEGVEDGAAGKWQAYYQRAGGAFTTSVLLTSGNDFTPDAMAVCSQPDETALRNGQHRYRGLKIWNATKTAAQLQREILSTKPRDVADLTFWNPMLDATIPHVDLSGTGGNFTLTGTPTANVSDPGVAWSQVGHSGVA